MRRRDANANDLCGRCGCAYDGVTAHGPGKCARSIARCKARQHYFPPFNESSDLGGGAQRCECGAVLIDRTLGGGRTVEIDRAAE